MVELLERWRRLDSHECHYNEYHHIFEVRLYNGALYPVRFPLNTEARYIIQGCAQDWCENRNRGWAKPYMLRNDIQVMTDADVSKESLFRCDGFGTATCDPSLAHNMLDAYLRALEAQ